MATTRPQAEENFSEYLLSADADEIAALQTLPWQAEVLPGESVQAHFTGPVITYLGGAMPFVETARNTARLFAEGTQHLKSDVLAQFLLQNRALFRGYLAAAAKNKREIIGDYEPAYVAQVTTDIPGMEAANFAFFLSAQLRNGRGGKTILVDADPQNQFVFPLLSLTDQPAVLTENLQKPSTFQADLGKAIIKLDAALSYLNLQASSLRPFSDDELSRIVCFLDSEFDNIVIYSGKHRSAWLSKNAHITFAVCEANFTAEAAALSAHRQGAHTVLLAKGKEHYFPCLTSEFGTIAPLDFWINKQPGLNAITTFVRNITTTDRLSVGGSTSLAGYLPCYTGINLYLRYAGGEEKDAEKVLTTLQNRLRAYYPRTAFFSTRSVFRAMAQLPKNAATTLMEVGDNVQIVSLLQSSELRAAAVFPAGILRPLKTGSVRISAVSADGLIRFRELAPRAGISRMIQAPRYRLKHPNALGAIMEQVQA